MNERDTKLSTQSEIQFLQATMHYVVYCIHGHILINAFQRLLQIFWRLSEGHMNVSEYFLKFLMIGNNFRGMHVFSIYHTSVLFVHVDWLAEVISHVHTSHLRAAQEKQNGFCG